MTKVTIDDIAKKLGISKSLVSLALNNKYGVSEETRFKIILTALELGYDFNRYEKRKAKSVYKIGVLVNQVDLLNNRFWVQILKGIENKINLVSKYRMKIIVWGDNNEDLIYNLINNDISGVIVISQLPNDLLVFFNNLRKPIVIIDSKEIYDIQADNVRVNNYLGGYEAAKYLVSKGHKRLVFLGDIKYSVSFQERYNGFKNYVENKTTDVELISLISEATSSDNDYLYNIKELHEYLDNLDNLPIAIMCANDPVAEFLYKELKARSIKLPTDVSVIGFDNSITSEMCNPRLTSVDVPTKTMGAVAVDVLINRINNSYKLYETIQIDVRINEKESVLALI